MNTAPDIDRFSQRAGLIEIAGELALCDPRGALFFPELRLLAVSDLHLEKGSSFARRGQLLPPYDTGATLDRLAAVIEDHAPQTVISLGDSFHDGWGAERMPGVYRDRLTLMMRGRDWVWVAGNHDPGAPADLPGTLAAEVAVGRLRFRHEPQPGAEAGEIAGHLHPGAVIVQRGRAVRRRCFATDGLRLVMPAFGAYTGMLNVRAAPFSGLFRWERFMAHMMGESRVYAIAGRRLRG